MRINARLDENHEQKLRAIQQATSLSTSKIIEQALDLLYERTSSGGKERNQRLLEKLAGIGTGPADGSVNYKKYVADYLDDKFNHR
ncbi:MAG: hypothetical protein ACRER2_12560 [Methylococcales bacterium]